MSCQTAFFFFRLNSSFFSFVRSNDSFLCPVKRPFLLSDQTSFSSVRSNGFFLFPVKQIFFPLSGQTSFSFFLCPVKRLFSLSGQTALSFVWSNDSVLSPVKRHVLCPVEQLCPLSVGHVQVVGNSETQHVISFKMQFESFS